MADRIVVLGANPGRILSVIENTLPRPRDYRSWELLKLVDQIHDIITGSEMPDIPPTRAAGTYLEPIPNVSPNNIVGLLEYLDAHGGKGEVFEISSDLGQEFGRIITTVKAAEILGFVETPRDAVALTVDGSRFVKAKPKERQGLWRDRILQLGLFRQVQEMLEKREDRRIDAELILEMIAMKMPTENYNRTFMSLVAWGRFGNLFAYNATEKTLSLQ